MYENFGQFINGKWQNSSSNETYEVINPATEEILGEVSKANKNDVRNLIGPPSSISSFNGNWFYIERKKTNGSLFKLGKKKLLSNNIIILEFNAMGLVSNKDLLNIKDMEDIKRAEKITKKNMIKIVY